MNLFIILATIKSIFLGAIWGRVDGGGIAKVPEWVERSLIMFFFVIACAPFAGYYALFAYLGVVGIATGHGQYFLNRVVKYIGDKADGKKGSYERVDPIVTLLFGRDPRTDTKFKDMVKDHQLVALKGEMEAYGMSKLYWRCVFGMFVTGTLVGIPAAIISLCFGEYIFALLFLLTGACKSLAYMVGYQFFTSSHNPSGTEAAEYVNGGLRTTVCVAVILLGFYAG